MRIGGLILAAGRSRRLGQPKALLTIDGRTILENLVAAYAALDSVVVVGSGPVLALRISATLVPADPDGQMIDSIIKGLDHLGPVDAVVLQPVDAPFTTPAMLLALTAAVDRPRVLAYDGAPGHPVLVPAAWLGQVRLRPQGGLRALLEGQQTLVPWPDPRILADLDTPEDLKRWLGEQQ